MDNLGRDMGNMLNGLVRIAGCGAVCSALLLVLTIVFFFLWWFK